MIVFLCGKNLDFSAAIGAPGYVQCRSIVFLWLPGWMAKWMEALPRPHAISVSYRDTIDSRFQGLSPFMLHVLFATVRCK